MKNKFYFETVGECVSHVTEIEGAKDWNDAKRLAFNDMSEGDCIAECPPSAVKEDGQFPEFHFIDKDECTEYAELCKGVWATTESGEDYWESRAWWFDDEDDTFYDGSFKKFDDLGGEED